MVARGAHYLRALACVAVVLASLGASVHARPAAAAPGLLVGATDEMFKLEPGRADAVAQDLGLTGGRVSLLWDGQRTTVDPVDAARLQAAASTHVRIVLAVWGWFNATPLTDAARDAYCSYVRDALVQVPRINDVVIWNEPNLSLFWQPQKDDAGNSLAPAAYEQLLARCWDVLHAYRPAVNVIGLATSPAGGDDRTGPISSHYPGPFIAGVGEAYRASGRTAPLFDTVSQHVYGATSAERPWITHMASSRRISEGDIGRLVGILQTAFAGTNQAAPGAPAGDRTVQIWYLESGFETVPTAEKAPLYSGTEIVDAIPDSTNAPPWLSLPVGPAPDQATQLRDALRLAYCQPYVGAIFNLQLQDEPALNRWQSGVLWADGTKKGSYDAWRSTIAEVNAHAVDCSQFGGAGGAVTPSDAPASQGLTPTPPSSPPIAPPQPPAPPGAKAAPKAERLVMAWLRGIRPVYSRHNRAWNVAVRANAAARFSAAIETARGAKRLERRGQLAPNARTRIEFSRRPLKVGTYRVVIRARGIALRSAPFRVR
jgi:hypothetical protein